MSPNPCRAREGGFTLIEALIVMTVLVIVATLGFPALQNLIHRGRIQGIAQETATLMQEARLEAIKRSAPAVVSIDPATGKVTGFLDLDRSGDFNSGDRQLGQYSLPQQVSFSSPTDSGAASIDGFANTTSSNPAYAADLAIFRPDGSADDTGAFRFGDRRGNYLEVRVDPAATARIRIRKWDGTNWLVPGQGGKPWEWK